MKKWIKKAVDEDAARTLAAELNSMLRLPKPEPDRFLNILSRLFVLRGLTTASEVKEFVNPDMAKLHDPYLMKDMDKAVERVNKAVSGGEKILVYGDYDVDGTTSVALMVSYLRQHSPDVIHYVPDRHKEGYGISKEGIDFAEQEGAELVIALDCGIKAVDKIAYANEKGIDFIICDHHLPGEVVPDATAILDPLQPGCEYPYKSLSGCAIGYKLITALERSEMSKGIDTAQFLDLVAVSLACDIVPLTGENRILAYFGIKRIMEGQRPGLRNLLKDVGEREVTVTDLVFKAGPVINSAGRMDHGTMAVSLLLEEDEEKAGKLSEVITLHNQNRKEEDKQITKEALELITSPGYCEYVHSAVLFNENWHKGVIGIVASRVIEHHYRPTIILTESNGKATGSARSIKGIDIYEALERCSEHLVQFGGHKYAAGLTLELEAIEPFRKAFEKVIKEMKGGRDYFNEVLIDAELSLKDITAKLYNQVKRLAPFGPSNMKPVFLTRNVTDYGYTRAVGSDSAHLKLYITEQSTGAKVKGIAFGFGHLEEQIRSGKPFDLVYTVEENIWNGNTSIEIMVKDISFDGKPLQ